MKQLQFCEKCIEVGWHEEIPKTRDWQDLKCVKCGTLTYKGASMSSDGCTKWCRRLEQCNYTDSNEIDMSRVNLMVSEFNHLTFGDQCTVMAYCCGQLTGWRQTLGIKKHVKNDYQWSEGKHERM